jgi:hypothetical protein
LLIALATGSAGRLAAQTAVTAEVKASAPSWRLIDTVPTGAPAQNNQLWEVSAGGVDDLPIDQAQKDMIHDAFSDDPDGSGTDIVYMSQDLLGAMENPDFPNGYEAYRDTTEKFSLGCSWDSETRNRSWPYNHSITNQSLPFSGGIDGHLNFDLPVEGQVQIAATYKIRKCFGVPVGFKFVSATASGNASISGTGDLTASAIGFIPVRLVFTLPIYAGVSLKAAVSGQVAAHLNATAGGTFSYTCTTNDCSGTDNFTNNFSFTGPTGSVSANLDAQAFARVMLRVSLYSSNIAFVEGGVKAYARANLWGYYGNACGDADGDGNNETVQALVADLGWGYQFAYGLGGWLLPDRTNYTGGGDFSLGWLDLLGTGGSTVFTPMISGAATATQGTAASYTVKLRPCYPYTQAVNFVMAPGTWTGGTSVSSGATGTAVQTTFTNSGNLPVTATISGDSSGRSLSGSTTRTINVAPTAPLAPNSPSVVVLSATSVRFSWNDTSNNETQFVIERRNSPSGAFSQIGTVGANVTSYVDNTVAEGTAYDYHVKSTNSAGSLGFSNTVTATTPLQTPGTLTGTTLSSTSVRLNWVDNSGSETGYNVERRVSPSGTFALIGTVTANVATYTDNTVAATTPYEYRVKAVKGTFSSAYSNTFGVTTTQTLPAAPTSLTATPLSATSVRLNWTDNSSNESSFDIQRRIYPAAFVSIASAAANATTYTDTTAQPGKQYDYQVRATNSAGSSAFTNVGSALTPDLMPAAPSGLTATYNTTTRVITLSWVDNSNNETGFTAQFSYSGSAFSDMGSTGANVTTYSTGSNPPTGSYQFRVAAYNSAGSAYSGTVSLLVTAPPPPATSILWIQTAESSWGPAGTLTAAGFATNGTGTIQLVWRERSTTGVWGAWTATAYQAVPSPDTTWSNTISSGNPTNKCHWFDAYTNYAGATSPVFHYTGAPGCP